MFAVALALALALVSVALAARHVGRRRAPNTSTVPQWAIDVFGERDARSLTKKSAKTHAELRAHNVEAIERRFTQMRRLSVRAVGVEADAFDRSLSVRFEFADGTWLRLTRIGMTSLDSVFDLIFFDLDRIKLTRLSLQEPWSCCVLRHRSRRVELYAVGVEISKDW